jgi:FAD/FMN-containing dehydrogenase
MATPVASRPGLTVGPTSEFSLFFRVVPGRGEALRAALRALQDTPGYRPGDYNVAIGTIHEARFVLFDDDTRLAFVTSFDGPWDAYMEDFFTSGPTLALFDVIFRHTEGYEGLPDGTAVKSFVLGAQQTAAAYARNYGGTVKEIRKAQRVNRAFQQVLDAPDAAEALSHPALAPLLAEAAD